MLRIKFTNGTELEYQEALETEEYFNGSSRRTLTVECEPTAIGIDELNAVLSKESNLAEIVMKNIDDARAVTAENIYSGYVLKLELGVKKKLLDPVINAYGDRLIFKVGKRTYIEEQLHKLGI